MPWLIPWQTPGFIGNRVERRYVGNAVEHRGECSETPSILGDYQTFDRRHPCVDFAVYIDRCGFAVTNYGGTHGVVSPIVDDTILLEGHELGIDGEAMTIGGQLNDYHEFELHPTVPSEPLSSFNMSGSYFVTEAINTVSVDDAEQTRISQPEASVLVIDTRRNIEFAARADAYPARGRLTADTIHWTPSCGDLGSAIDLEAGVISTTRSDNDRTDFDRDGDYTEPATYSAIYKFKLRTKPDVW